MSSYYLGLLDEFDYGGYEARFYIVECSQGPLSLEVTQGIVNALSKTNLVKLRSTPSSLCNMLRKDNADQLKKLSGYLTPIASRFGYIRANKGRFTFNSRSNGSWRPDKRAGILGGFDRLPAGHVALCGAHCDTLKVNLFMYNVFLLMSLF